MNHNSICPLCEAQFDEYRLVKENNYAFCIINKNYLVDGHVMIIPKRHILSLDNLNKEESYSLTSLTAEIISLIKKKHKKDPIMIMNTGTHCSQEHLHIHVFPSNAACRDLLSHFDKISIRPERSKNDLCKQKALLC